MFGLAAAAALTLGLRSPASLLSTLGSLAAAAAAARLALLPPAIWAIRSAERFPLAAATFCAGEYPSRVPIAEAAACDPAPISDPPWARAPNALATPPSGFIRPVAIPTPPASPAPMFRVPLPACLAILTACSPPPGGSICEAIAPAANPPATPPATPPAAAPNPPPEPPPAPAEATFPESVADSLCAAAGTILRSFMAATARSMKRSCRSIIASPLVFPTTASNTVTTRDRNSIPTPSPMIPFSNVDSHIPAIFRPPGNAAATAAAGSTANATARSISDMSASIAVDIMSTAMAICPPAARAAPNNFVQDAAEACAALRRDPSVPHAFKLSTG